MVGQLVAQCAHGREIALVTGLVVETEEIFPRIYMVERIVSFFVFVDGALAVDAGFVVAFGVGVEVGTVEGVAVVVVVGGKDGLAEQPVGVVPFEAVVAVDGFVVGVPQHLGAGEADGQRQIGVDNNVVGPECGME